MPELCRRRQGDTMQSHRGSNGFGWDAIFIPEGYDQTWAEMTDEEARETSMRSMALKKLGTYLKSK